MLDTQKLLEQAKLGFQTLTVNPKFQEQALVFLEQWLEPEFEEYHQQIEHLIKNHYWDYLLDSFYQIIPFGTGGRRGEVGIGPNRINPWTIKSSAQGHSQYLLKRWTNSESHRGLILAYDVRQFSSNKFFNDELPNPVRNLSCKDLAIAAAEVYTGNGIKVYIFDDIRTTPELSFAIRYKNTLGGSMFSASHNPPEHNGQKVFDEYGGQLIPPFDEELVKEVTEHLGTIEQNDLKVAEQEGLVEYLGQEVDDAYIEELKKVSLSDKRDIKIVYTPLHGTGTKNTGAVLEALGFKIHVDPKTSNPSGKFENVTFNIPNPEVEQSFETSLKYAKELKADIILNTDPDSDRIGIMVHHNDQWVFLNGNEIASILAEYAIGKRHQSLKGRGIVIKTVVTTNLVGEICKAYGVDLIGDLLVGYKYVAHEMNQLEKAEKMDNFIFGCEESHGYNTGNYAREKDSAPAAVWLAELAAELKEKDKTLVDYLNDIYSKYGYFRNYLTEIRLPGAEGRGQIDKIQQGLRDNPPALMGRFKVNRFDDYLTHLPIVSETDASSKNMLVFNFEPVEGTISIKITIRPSGTEPKSKFYFEIGSNPFDVKEIDSVRQNTEAIVKELEKDVLQYCYRILGIDFPDRGFLLFWQLPLPTKMKYFEIEEKIIELKEVSDKEKRERGLLELLGFLGSDPVAKVDDAFKAEYKVGIKEYLDL